MKWPPLITGTLLKRYKRFLADVRLQDNRIVTAHCPNSGSMISCSDPESTVYLSFHDDPRRKLPYTWQLIAMPTSLVGVNTLVPNRLVYQSIADGQVAELTGFAHIQREVKVGAHSRIDLCLIDAGRPACFVEIKNCTFVQEGRAMFPDAVTVRGQKHLTELASLRARGHRCVMFFLIQRMDARQFQPAEQIDPTYARLLRQGFEKGIEILAYDVRIDLTRITLNRRLPVIL